MKFKNLEALITQHMEKFEKFHTFEYFNIGNTKEDLSFGSLDAKTALIIFLDKAFNPESFLTKAYHEITCEETSVVMFDGTKKTLSLTPGGYGGFQDHTTEKIDGFLVTTWPPGYSSLSGDDLLYEQKTKGNNK